MMTCPVHGATTCAFTIKCFIFKTWAWSKVSAEWAFFKMRQVWKTRLFRRPQAPWSNKCTRGVLVVLHINHKIFEHPRGKDMIQMVT